MGPDGSLRCDWRVFTQEQDRHWLLHLVLPGQNLKKVSKYKPIFVKPFIGMNKQKWYDSRYHCFNRWFLVVVICNSVYLNKIISNLHTLLNLIASCLSSVVKLRGVVGCRWHRTSYVGNQFGRPMFYSRQQQADMMMMVMIGVRHQKVHLYTCTVEYLLSAWFPLRFANITEIKLIDFIAKLT